jgi:hypothetical protein
VIKHGYPASVARPVCACEAQYLLDNYSESELMNSQNPKTISDEVQAACLAAALKGGTR